MVKNNKYSVNTTEPIPVNVVDPSTKKIWPAELCHDSDGFFLKQSSDQAKDAELFLSPGWIDLHAHVLGINGPVYDLPTTMTKLCAAGMDLVDVIEAVTASPAEILQLDDWCNLRGKLHNATLFKLSKSAPVSRKFIDCVGKEIFHEKYIIPTAIINKEKMKWLDYPLKNVKVDVDPASNI